MKENLIVLSRIADRVDAVFGHEVGPPELDHVAGILTLADGRLTITAEVETAGSEKTVGHAHIIAEVAGKHPGPLDACMIGIGKTDEERLKGIGDNWLQMAAAPILSIALGRQLEGCSVFCCNESDCASGLQGYAGPLIGRFKGVHAIDPQALDATDFYQYLPELVPPGRLHLAKITTNLIDPVVIERTLEIDGHRVTFLDRCWKPKFENPAEPCMFACFAVVYPVDTARIVAERANWDRLVAAFVECVAGNPEFADLYEFRGDLIGRGFPEAAVERLILLAPIAFAWLTLGNSGVTFAQVFFPIEAGGTIGEPRPYVTEPAFARALVYGQTVVASEAVEKAMRNIATCSAEFNALNKALNDGASLDGMNLLPTLIPEANARNVDTQIALEYHYDHALEAYRGKPRAPTSKPGADARNPPSPVPAARKPWWKFW